MDNVWITGEACFVEVHCAILLLDMFENLYNKKFKHILAMIGYEQIRTKDRIFDQMNSQGLGLGIHHSSWYFLNRQAQERELLFIM